MTEYENVGVHVEIPEIETENLEFDIESAQLVVDGKEIYHLEPTVEHKEEVDTE